MPSSTQWLVPCPACRQQHLVSGAQIRDRSWLTMPCQACQEAHPAPDASAAGDAASPPNPDAERYERSFALGDFCKIYRNPPSSKEPSGMTTFALGGRNNVTGW